MSLSFPLNTLFALMIFSIGGSTAMAGTSNAFWPVVDTEIGRLGIMMANEGSYPENARALAMNGAEVVYRASYPHPATGNDIFEFRAVLVHSTITCIS